MDLLDWLTIASYGAINLDIVFEIRKIQKTKSSEDLSLLGMTMRYGAIMIILVKFISLEEKPLIIGQGLIALTFTFYFALAYAYFHNKPTKD
jgi:hypothetical protein